MKIKKNLKSIIRIAKIELNSMFYSPVAWLIVIIFACQIGYSFYESFDRYLHIQDLNQGLWALTANIFIGMQGLLEPILRNLYLYIPLVTMGLMSREYSSGSIKLLYSSPINNASIILGKFASMMLYAIVLMGILIFVTIFCTIFIKEFDYPILLSALLGFYLLILAYSAIGLFMSSLTQYQVVAAIGTLALLASLNFVGTIGQSIDFVRDITYWLSISSRTYPFLEGLIPSEDVCYFIIVIVTFLSLSIFKLNTEKTVMSKTKKITGYSSIILCTIIFGYITSLPQLKFYYDATFDRANTLSDESRQIVEKVKKEKGDLTIVTYANILSSQYHCAIPSQRINDASRFEKYTRFMPGIKMEYVLYYDKTSSPSYTAQRFAGSSLEENAQLVCKSDRIDFDKVLSPEAFKAKYGDFEEEGYRFVRRLFTPDGDSITLRIFKDNEAHPAEAQVSAAMASFVEEYPSVSFYSTNEDRAIDNYGDRGYFLFAHDKWFRNSLLNNGFKVKTVDVEVDDLSTTDILVISDIKSTLSDLALSKIKEFADRGGNLFIAGNYQRSEYMNPIVEMFGVKMGKDVIVEESSYYHPSIVATNFTKEAGEKYIFYNKLEKYEYKVSINRGVALDYSDASAKGFEVIPVLKTSADAWEESETTDFIDGQFICNAEANESKAERNVLVHLQRKVNGKEQRIIVSGDTDMIANSELTAAHPKMQAQNYSIINGSFRYLSNDVYPVDVSQPTRPDDEIYLPKGSRKYVKALFLFLIPLVLLAMSISIIVKRQRK